MLASESPKPLGNMEVPGKDKEQKGQMELSTFVVPSFGELIVLLILIIRGK
jgi:hypothetical protein